MLRARSRSVAGHGVRAPHRRALLRCPAPEPVIPLPNPRNRVPVQVALVSAPIDKADVAAYSPETCTQLGNLYAYLELLRPSPGRAKRTLRESRAASSSRTNAR